MCGIAGIFHYAEPERPIDRNLLEAMTRSIEHRGPDAAGIHIDGPIGLGHRRLAIVDLSETGAQPMRTGDGSGYIVYNGEFYNHAEFRSRLEQRGVRFRGTSDTETLLHLMREYGPSALETAAGIFGFAYWDAKDKKLTLARDPLGVKQVYYHDDGRRLLFASEIKALLVDPMVRREADPLAVSEYLHFHTPLFERTFFKGIRQVRAGECITFGRFHSQARTYWMISDFEKAKLETQEHVEELAGRIEHVVKDQLMSGCRILQRWHRFHRCRRLRFQERIARPLLRRPLRQSGRHRRASLPGSRRQISWPRPATDNPRRLHLPGGYAPPPLLPGSARHRTRHVPHARGQPACGQPV